jgi:filamentous hemagglutinin
VDPRFKEISDKADYNLDDDINKIGVVRHKGPHPEEYHLAVYRRLVEAVRGKEGKDYKKGI